MKEELLDLNGKKRRIEAKITTRSLTLKKGLPEIGKGLKEQTILTDLLRG